MAIRRAVLVIADIGGYTKFMSWNRMHLSHAQKTVAELLEAVIDAGKGLQLAKLEGDAAFFWAPDGDAAALVGERLARIRAAFLERRAQAKADHACTCDSCEQIENLSIKFVTHQGEVAEQKVKHHTELAGMDVILLHRMLKNDVPVPEYVLMTDTVLERLDPKVQALAKPLPHDFEGIGPTATHFIDFHTAGESLPTAVDRGFFGHLWARAKFGWSTLPYLLGFKKSCEGYRHLGLVALPVAGEAKPLPTGASPP